MRPAEQETHHEHDGQRPGAFEPMTSPLLRLISPSGALPEPQRLERARQRLRELGWRVEIDTAAARRSARFAGTDAQRLAALHRAARSGAEVVMATRGGYGLSRLLHRIDYALLDDAIRNRGQRWVGHSDFTALQLALLARSGAVTFSGPMADYDFAGDTLDEITADSLVDALDGSQEAIGFACADAPRGLDAGGVLWGGNLSMVCSVVGTPYLPAVDGVLFVEDVGEHPYAIERLFAQLLHAGVLQRQRAIVLGAFTGYRLVAHDAGYDLAQAIDWVRAQLKPWRVPVLGGLPFGHQRTKVTLPHGAPCRVVRDGGEVYLLF